jgi:hypothetical protein
LEPRTGFFKKFTLHAIQTNFELTVGEFILKTILPMSALIFRPENEASPSGLPSAIDK